MKLFFWLSVILSVIGIVITIIHLPKVDWANIFFILSLICLRIYMMYIRK